MKKKNFIVSFIFAFLMCFSLNFSMNSTTAYAEESQTEITINFKPNNGSTIASQTIQKGQTISEFPTAEKFGYIFVGWSNGFEIVSTSTVFNENTTLTAEYLRKINKYTISKPDSYFSIVGETQDSNVDYTLSDTCNSLEDAMTLISEDLTSQSNSTTIIFEDITLTQDLNLSFAKLTLSGIININEYSIIYSVPENSSELNLTDLTINANSSQDLMKITNENSSTITISNVNFNSESNQNTYSLKLEEPKHSLVFENNLSYSTQYLYNFEMTQASIALFKQNFNLTSPSKIAITIPYEIDNQAVLNTYYDTSKFEIYSNQSNFTSTIKNKNGLELIVRTSFNINFDENGSTITTPINSSGINYRTTTQFNFPTEQNYSKQHYILNNFVGKITLDAQTMQAYSIPSSVWYFDKTAFENLKTANMNLASIPTCFYSDLSQAQSENTLLGFNYYKYDKYSADLNFLAVQFMLDLNQTPEFVALWNKQNYTVSFDENGGSLVEDITKTYDETITLPTTTKTGYDFIGWFENLDKANNPTNNTPININKMPDTNPTFFAGWQVHTHKLTIYTYDLASKIETIEDFGTPLNSIDELDKNNLSKSGYTFVDWYTDENFINKLTLTSMPDNDLTIYAKWSINTYTITLYNNYETNEPIFKTTNKIFNSAISNNFFTEKPVREGFTFLCWCEDDKGLFPYDLNPKTQEFDYPTSMPSMNINLYASWSENEYILTLHYPAIPQTTTTYLNFGESLNLNTPSYSGLIFDGWFNNENFTEENTLTTMPNGNLTLYAKLTEKQTISLNLTPQSYTLSQNNGFELNETLENFTIEYFVNEDWTTEKPTLKGVYDVRISRAEDALYKQYVQVFESALTITANDINVEIIYLVLYSIAIFEIVCSIILLFLNKQRKTYLTYSVILPFGIISNSQFINLIISLILAIFGFVLLIIQLVNLRKINLEITKISTENEDYIPPDKSEDSSISKNVEILLEKEGFVSAKNKSDNDKNNDKDDKQKNDEDEYLTFKSKKQDTNFKD